MIADITEMTGRHESPIIPHLNGAWREFDPRRIKPDPNNPRKTFHRIPQLARSIKALGQSLPGKVTLLQGDPDFDAMLVDGERRLRACIVAEMPFKAFIEEAILSPSERLRQALGMNFNQEPHDHMEIAFGLRDLMELSKKEEKTLTQDEIAEVYGKSNYWVSVHLSLLRLTPKVQQMMIQPDETADPTAAALKKARRNRKRGYLPYSNALLLVNLEAGLQERLAENIVKNEMSQTQARRYIIKQTGAEGVGGVLRVASPGEASTVFGNKMQTIQDYLGGYCDMDFKRLQQVFATSSTDEVRGYADILTLIMDNAVGLKESIRAVIRHKTEEEMEQIRASRYRN
jgi:ParB/RepB/Spo0J family partition protein